MHRLNEQRLLGAGIGNNDRHRRERSLHLLSTLFLLI